MELAEERKSQELENARNKGKKKKVLKETKGKTSLKEIDIP